MAEGRAALTGRIVATFCLFAFAALALASGFDRLSTRSPALARFIPPMLRAEASRSEARLAVIRQQPEDALVHARRAVAIDPLHPSSTALLGTAYLLKGDAAKAEAAFRVAARFGWRDPATQLYWYEAAMQSGDLPRAVDRADALLRVRPGYSGLEAILIPLESTPEGRAALIARMSGRPDWLRYYLLPDSKMSEDTFIRRSTVLTELAAAGTSLGCEPVRNFVNFALQRGARKQAAAIWSGHCAGAKVDPGLADGGFDVWGSAQTSPFGWKEHLSGDVTIRAVDKEAGNRAVQMSNRSSVSRMVLSQALSLEPGEYLLTGTVPPGRVAASLGCGRQPGVPSGIVGDIGSGGQRLTVPECDRLQLGLWLRAGEDETEIDNLKLERVS